MKTSPRLLLAALVLLAGTVLGCTIPMSAQLTRQLDAWHLTAYRVVFFHMPYAFAGTFAFMFAAAQAGLYLLTRNLRWDRLAHGSAETGLVFLALATVSGMLFARTQWGAWWSWDPRQTSVFFVLLMYAAYLLLRDALPGDPALRARLGSAYLLMAVAPMIWLVMIFPHTGKAASGSLHPKAPFEALQWRVIFVNLGGLMLAYWEAILRHARIGADAGPQENPQ